MKYQIKFKNTKGQIVSATHEVMQIAPIVRTIEQHKGVIVSCQLKKEIKTLPRELSH